MSNVHLTGETPYTIYMTPATRESVILAPGEIWTAPKPDAEFGTITGQGCLTRLHHETPNASLVDAVVVATALEHAGYKEDTVPHLEALKNWAARLTYDKSEDFYGSKTTDANVSRVDTLLTLLGGRNIDVNILRCDPLQGNEGGYKGRIINPPTNNRIIKSPIRLISGSPKRALLPSNAAGASTTNIVNKSAETGGPQASWPTFDHDNKRFYVNDVDADGDCFFHSIKVGLESAGVNPLPAADVLRHMCFTAYHNYLVSLTDASSQQLECESWNATFPELPDEPTEEQLTELGTRGLEGTAYQQAYAELPKHKKYHKDWVKDYDALLAKATQGENDSTVWASEPVIPHMISALEHVLGKSVKIHVYRGTNPVLVYSNPTVVDGAPPSGGEIHIYILLVNNNHFQNLELQSSDRPVQPAGPASSAVDSKEGRKEVSEEVRKEDGGTSPEVDASRLQFWSVINMLGQNDSSAIEFGENAAYWNAVQNIANPPPPPPPPAVQPVKLPSFLNSGKRPSLPWKPAARNVRGEYDEHEDDSFASHTNTGGIEEAIVDYFTFKSDGSIVKTIKKEIGEQPEFSHPILSALRTNVAAIANGLDGKSAREKLVTVTDRLISTMQKARQQLLSATVMTRRPIILTVNKVNAYNSKIRSLNVAYSQYNWTISKIKEVYANVKHEYLHRGRAQAPAQAVGGGDPILEAVGRIDTSFEYLAPGELIELKATDGEVRNDGDGTDPFGGYTLPILGALAGVGAIIGIAVGLSQ